MGYTHYWYQKKDFTVEQWSNIREGMLAVIVQHCDRKNIVLAQEYDSPSEPQPTLFGGPKFGPTPPMVNAVQIRFNGWRGEGHETFLLTRKKPEARPYRTASEDHFSFCKTAHKPYDLAVCLALLVCVRHAPDVIKISSDGGWDNEWLEARKVFKELFGVEPSCPFEEEVTA